MATRYLNVDLSPACDYATNDHCYCDNVVDTLERASESYRLTDWEATFARDIVPLLDVNPLDVVFTISCVVPAMPRAGRIGYRADLMQARDMAAPSTPVIGRAFGDLARA